MTPTSSDSGGPALAYRVTFLDGSLRTSLLDSCGLPVRVPTAPQELHTLVVLLLRAGRPVADLTIAHVLFGDDEDKLFGAKTALTTHISRLRGPRNRKSETQLGGWPVAKGTYKLDIAPASVDILDFHDRAGKVIDEAKRPSLKEPERNRLLEEGRSLASLWKADPAEPYKDSERVAALFSEFHRRHQALIEVLEKLENASEADHAAGSGPGTSVVTALRPELRAAYLTDVLRRSSVLSFGDPISRRNEPGQKDPGPPMHLGDVWTPLRVADSKTRSGRVGTHESMAEHDDGRPLLEVVDAVSEALLLLGAPGSGKSSSVSMLAAAAAHRAFDAEGETPIWVNLGSVTPGAGQSLSTSRLLLTGVPEIDEAVSHAGPAAGAELLNHLDTVIISGRAVLLLDGLDEVKEYALTPVRNAIADLVRVGRNRIIVTCRRFDYRHTDPVRRVPIERELELLPFNSKEKAAYIARWYKSATQSGIFSPRDADSLTAALQNQIRNVEALSEMGELPLLLALLTLIHSQQELPHSRALVCEQAIRAMLSYNPPWRDRKSGEVTDTTIGHILRLAVEIAYCAHVIEEEQEDGATGITRALVESQATRLGATLARSGPNARVPDGKTLADAFMGSHGLLLEVGPDRYKFSHRYFQEFLAGQHFARGADHKNAVSKGSSLHWMVPFRLMASFAGQDQGRDLHYILSLVRDLLAGPALSAQQLGAEMLAEITREGLLLWNFELVLDDVDGDDIAGMWGRTRELITAQVENSSLELHERERAGTVLADLGDPRFIDPATDEPKGAWQNIVEFPEVAVRIGSDRIDPSSMVGGFAASARSFDFDGFALGKYPVTNADFSAFVDAGGYANTKYWESRLSRGWATGDSEVLDELRAHWLDTVDSHHAKELRDGEIIAADLANEAHRRTAPRAAPFYWHDRRFNRPNQPVVGINYWEAEAYCAWATIRGHAVGSLSTELKVVVPTEFEWERASRPVDDDRLYPWGDEWREEFAHVSSNLLNMRQPAPTGIYPAPWSGAPRDLAGNVWEWTSTLFLPYDSEYDGQRLDSDSMEERVVRGSSWYNQPHLAECSCRAVDRAYNLFYDVGFRIAIVSVTQSRAGISQRGAVIT